MSWHQAYASLFVEQFDTHCTPNQNILMETRGREAFVIGRSKVDAKCSSSLTVRKRARVPQMEIEDTVQTQRPGTA